MRALLLSLTALLGVSTARAQDQAELPPRHEAPDASGPPAIGSFELRTESPGTLARWSTGDSPDAAPGLTRSIHYVGGAGLRFFHAPSGHGALIDVSLANDFGDRQTRDAGTSDPEVGVFRIHVGYAWRLTATLGRRSAVALTPHLAFAFGGTACHSSGFRDGCVSAIRWLVGVRVGADLDWHFRRFFFGWSLRYGLVRHVGYEALGRSHLIGFNVLPRFGFVFGAPVSPPP